MSHYEDQREALHDMMRELKPGLQAAQRDRINELRVGGEGLQRAKQREKGEQLLAMLPDGPVNPATLQSILREIITDLYRL